MALYASYYPSPRNVDEVVDLVGLSEKRDARVIKLSGGQQRRLDVAIALAGDPELLFLDEPTTGFDPGARRHAWDVIGNLAELGKTIFLTTHYMDEAQNLANRVAVITKGEIVAEGPPSTLVEQHLGRTVIRFRRPPGDLPPSVRDGSTVGRRDRDRRGGTDPNPLRADLVGRGARYRARGAPGDAADPRGCVPRAHRGEAGAE